MRSCPVCRREARRLRLRDARAAAAHPHNQLERQLARLNARRALRRHVLPQLVWGALAGVLIGGAAAAVTFALGVHP